MFIWGEGGCGMEEGGGDTLGPDLPMNITAERPIET